MEQWFSGLFQAVDPLLVQLFLLTKDPVVNFFIGSFVLAMGCTIIGEATIILAIRWNRSHIENLKEKVRHHERLSIQAFEMGDRQSYQALNKAANDAWGRHFFTMTAYSAGMLWPVPFALGWMQVHFANVRLLIAFPFSLLVGETVGFAFCFIPIYILCRILFSQRHRWLPGIRGLHQAHKAGTDTSSTT